MKHRPDAGAKSTLVMTLQRFTTPRNSTASRQPSPMRRALWEDRRTPTTQPSSPSRPSDRGTAANLGGERGPGGWRSSSSSPAASASPAARPTQSSMPPWWAAPLCPPPLVHGSDGSLGWARNFSKATRWMHGAQPSGTSKTPRSLRCSSQSASLGCSGRAGDCRGNHNSPARDCSASASNARQQAVAAARLQPASSAALRSRLSKYWKTRSDSCDSSKG
mmetsp:Transcript_68860/g.213731  ORF Transcript_68860/g.213731 Transcript_68860/m.213731 type:complete len:220 (-) Transcript_68860:62-721(-)